jgi:hypothetical protein
MRYTIIFLETIKIENKQGKPPPRPQFYSLHFLVYSRHVETVVLLEKNKVTAE